MTRDLTKKELKKRAEIIKSDIEKYGLKKVESYNQTTIMLLNAFAVIETAQERS